MKSLYHPVNLDFLEIPGNIFAAPMAGYTDAAARQLYLEGGASAAFTEMVSAEALVRGSIRTRRMTDRAAGESILAVQLFGSDPEVLGRAAAQLKKTGADLVDLNAACPVPKVTKKGAGAALAGDTGRLFEAVKAMKECGLPVTVKIRAGWDNEKLNYIQASQAAVRAGAAAVSFHPRTRSQGYSGKADWDRIKELTALIPVPVIGSGDLYRAEDARDMLLFTGCAAVMFARGAVGKPDIFMQTVNLLEKGIIPSETEKEEQLKRALRHLELAESLFGERRAFLDTKKHLARYISGWETATVLRRDVMRSPDMQSLKELLQKNASP